MKRNLSLLIALLMAASTLVFAESTDCHWPNNVVPDGRPTYNNGYLAANASYYWAFVGQSGHSYSLELNYDASNDSAAGAPGLSQYQLFNTGDNFCSTTTTLTFYRTDGTSPVMETTGTSKRLGFIAPKSGFYGFWAQEGANGGTYSFRIVDTTMFNPRWSTWSGFSTSWGFNNNSDQTISGTFTIYDGSGAVLKTKSVSLPAGKVTFFSSGPSDLNLPNNVAGSAMFAYVGPPGAIQVDAYMLNGSGTVVIPTKFEPRNAQW